MTADLRSTEGVSTRAVDRALALLSEVCGRESVSLTEAARSTGIPTSTALRLLRTLESAGFVGRAGDGSFSAGPRLLQLGATALGRNSLIRLAQPALDRIALATGETTYLSVRGPGDCATYIAMAESTRSVRHTSWIGRSVPLAGLAVGRALAGELPAADYVVQRDGFESDVTAIASAVRRPGGIAAAMSVLGPTYRIDDRSSARFGLVLASEAHALSAALGVNPATEQESDA